MLNYPGLSEVIIMTCLSSSVILFIVPGLVFTFSPLICPEKSIVCQWRIACFRYNWYFNKMVVFVPISTTEHSSPDPRNYLVLSDIFLQNWEDDCDLKMIRFGWLDCRAGYQFSLIWKDLSRQDLNSIQVRKFRRN